MLSSHSVQTSNLILILHNLMLRRPCDHIGSMKVEAELCGFVELFNFYRNIQLWKKYIFTTL
jgi:hypothetical protein